MLDLFMCFSFKSSKGSDGSWTKNGLFLSQIYTYSEWVFDIMFKTFSQCPHGLNVNILFSVLNGRQRSPADFLHSGLWQLIWLYKFLWANNPISKPQCSDGRSMIPSSFRLFYDH